MALGATEIVRGASGILFMLVGLGIGAIAARGVAHRTRAIALALYCFFFGAVFIPFNFFPIDDPELAPRIVAAHLALWVAVLLALVGLVATLPRPSTRDLAVGAALAALSLTTVMTLPLTFDTGRRIAGVHESAADLYFVDVILQRVIVTVDLFAAFMLARSAARTRDATSALLAFGLLAYPAILAGENAIGLFARVDLGWAFAVTVAWALAIAAAWLVAGAQRAPFGVALALLFPALILVGQVEVAITGVQTGIVGVVRIASCLAIAVAVLRHDLLGARLGARTTRRGSAAVVGLATLFVVAQATLPFLPGGVGLALGGVVAAGLTLASPLVQRSFDRGPSTAPTSDDKLATYREAVRYALRDGVMSRKEEIHLASLAQHLHIGAADALRVRHEVEDEREGVKRNP